MSDLEVQLRNSLAALDDLKSSFEQQRTVWQEECEGMQLQLAQARQREAALLQQNEHLTRKLVDLGSLPENNSLLRQFKIWAGISRPRRSIRRCLMRIWPHWVRRVATAPERRVTVPGRVCGRPFFPDPSLFPSLAAVIGLRILRLTLLHLVLRY